MHTQMITSCNNLYPHANEIIIYHLYTITNEMKDQHFDLTGDRAGELLPPEG
jgi:hypothetical protein